MHVWIGLGWGSGWHVAAAALDAPHTLHRAKQRSLIFLRPIATQPALATAARARSNRATLATTSHAVAQLCIASAAGKAALRRGAARASARQAALHPRRHRYYERFTASSFATADQFAGDITAGEDPIVRQAAIDALGDMNGTAVVIDPSNGRILAMVNQKLALSPGAEPCSTIKLTVAMAALSEGLVTRDTPVQLAGFRMNMTQALAKSNNLYFEELGRELGFERVRHYATQFGLGELAGYNIDGEQLGAVS